MRGLRGHFALEDFLGAATIVSRLDVPGANSGAKLNDAAWLALESSERFDRDPIGVLQESRAGRWFERNGREETLRFVGDVGASTLVPAVRDGSLIHLDPGSLKEPRAV